MAIRLWHTGPGSEGRTRGILSDALAPFARSGNYSGIFYLCPTRHILESRRLAFHGLAKQVSGSCYIPPLFLTLPQLGRMLQARYLKKPIFDKALRPAVLASIGNISQGHAGFVSEFITEMKHQFPCASLEDIRASLDAAYSAANAPEEASNRGIESLELMAAYNEALGGIGFIDEDDIIPLSAGFADRLDIRLLVLDGFYELLPSEEQLVHALIANTNETIAFVPISGPDDDLSYCYSRALDGRFQVKPERISGEPAKRPMAYYPAASIEAEVEEIARRIKAAYLSSTNRELDETWVVFPVIEPYRSLVGRVFRRFGIPHLFSSGRPCISHPAYQGIMALLESARDGLPRLAFTRFLTSPHFANTPESIREKAASVGLSNSLLKGQSAWIKAFEPIGLGKEIRSIISPIMSKLNTDNVKSYSALINNLLEVSGRLGFSPPGGFSAFEERLGGLCVLDRLTPAQSSLSGFIEALKSMLATTLDEDEQPGVRVASIFDVRGLEPRMLYMGGLKDGDFPSRPEMDFILPDNIRKRLGLLDLKRFMHLQSRIFRRLSTGAREAFYSYPTMEADKYFLPSLFISEGEPISTPTGGIYSAADLQRSQASGAEDIRFGEIAGIHRSQTRGPLRVTEIDSYRRCPRRHFIEHVLGLEPSEAIEYEIEAPQIGPKNHKVIHRHKKTPHPAETAFRARASNVLEETLAESSLDQYQKALLNETFLNIMDGIYETEKKLSDEGFEVHEKEYKVEGAIEGVELTGKADRIDRKDDGSIEIIDYKTGSADISASDVQKGKSLQLFLYAAMLKANDQRPERVGIYSLRDVKIKWVPNARDSKKGLNLNELMNYAAHYLKDTASAIDNGDYPAKPVNENDCPRCPESPYCPFVNGGSR